MEALAFRSNPKRSSSDRSKAASALLPSLAYKLSHLDLTYDVVI